MSQKNTQNETPNTSCLAKKDSTALELKAFIPAEGGRGGLPHSEQSPRLPPLPHPLWRLLTAARQTDEGR